jgi:hypothetical protein
VNVRPPALIDKHAGIFLRGRMPSLLRLWGGASVGLVYPKFFGNIRKRFVGVSRKRVVGKKERNKKDNPRQEDDHERGQKNEKAQQPMHN